MRCVDFGVIKNLAQSISPDVSLELYKHMCEIRYFEKGLIDAVNGNFVTYPLYLSSGQEAIAAAMSLAIPEFAIFAQHRCHAIYLALGGNPERLRDELLGLPTGTSGGRAGSNCIQCHEDGITMYGHHGLIGENVPLGVGAALGNGKPTVCFFGDGAAEEDYVFAAMGFAVTHNLPVLFVCEDNNLSIMTTLDTRRSWSTTNVAKALGMVSVEIADDPWSVLVKTLEIKNKLPAFINIYSARANWHVGIGTDGPPEWDRFGMVKAELEKLGYSDSALNISQKIQAAMEELWDSKLLRTLSGK